MTTHPVEPKGPRPEGSLVFERPSRYRDRAKRYCVVIDDIPCSPRISSLSKITVAVSDGPHQVRIFTSKRGYSEFTVIIGPNENRILVVAPRLWPLHILGPSIQVLDVTSQEIIPLVQGRAKGVPRDAGHGHLAP
jgi:hypothetical protein